MGTISDILQAARVREGVAGSRRARDVVRAVRAPLTVAAAALLLAQETIQQTLTLALASETVLHRMFYLRLDYWLYTVNVVVFGTSVLCAIVLLELKGRIVGPNRSVRADVVTAGTALVVAWIPVVLSTNVRSGRLQLLMCGMFALSFAAFACVNAGLAIFQRAVAEKRWFRRFVDLTFPISDFFFYAWHRDRIDARALRAVPVVALAAGLGLAVVPAAVVLLTAERAEKLALPTDYTYFTTYGPDGFWFSASGWDQPWIGIWRYDARSRAAVHLARIADAQRFHAHGGRLYAYDRARGAMVALDAGTGRLIWETSLPRGYGTVDVAARGDRMYATAEGGLIAVLDTAGTIRALRTFPFRTRYPQVLNDGRLVFVAGDFRLHIWDATLTQSEQIGFPLAGSGGPRADAEAVGAATGRRGSEYAATWSDYDETEGVFYVASAWGEIFRYDVRHGRWLPSLRGPRGVRSIAVDRPNHVLLAATYYGGVVDVLDLETGQHRGSVLAKPLTRFITVDPARRSALVNTFGYGTYRLRYPDLAPTRGAQRR